MSKHDTDLTVKREEISGFSYQICIRENFDKIREAFEACGIAGKDYFIVSDSNVAPLYAESLMTELRKISSKVSLFTFKAGEKHKTLSTIQDMYEQLILGGYDRKCILVALGGGVVGDMTGYCAATYLRGVDFVQIPTTLLSQVDSSIGGKTGVDFLSYKNMVGAFHQPRLVYMNLQCFATLPDEEFACGMAEVIKSALLADQSYFTWLEEEKEHIKNHDLHSLREMIFRCCGIKRDVVERDPKEQGDRAKLNLGHTIGHAVEKLKNFTLLHGQCVSIGMVAAGRISIRRNLLSEKEFRQICQLLSYFDLPLSTDGLDEEEILRATKKDKKMEQGKVKFILMQGIGTSIIDHTLTDEDLLCGIKEII